MISDYVNNSTNCIQDTYTFLHITSIFFQYFITPEQYDAATYPPFVTGPSYLLSRSAVDLLLSGALQRPFFHLEDVFVTGIVAEEVGVPRRNAPEFRNNANPIPVAFLGCTLTR